MALNWRSGRFQAGKLRHRIDIVQVSPIQDSTGGINWSVDVLYANVWASVEALSGRETLVMESQASMVTHQILIRYIGAAPSWQADFNYTAGMLCKDSNGYLQQAQGPGTSGSVAPDWSTIEGMFTEDGDPSTGVPWKNLGVAPPYTGVTAAMQVLFQGRQFQVTSVMNPDERNKMLCLSCTEINDSRQQIPGLNLPQNDLG
jgi:head-tail adaptor